MADMNSVHNVGAFLAVLTSILPQSATAGTINGSVVIDRVAHGMAGSCVLHSVVGAVSGAPTAITITTKLQDSADGVNFADYKPDGANVATATAITAANKETTLNVDLALARRYIRAVTTVAFTGGSSPAALNAADIVLGGERILNAV